MTPLQKPGTKRSSPASRMRDVPLGFIPRVEGSRKHRAILDEVLTVPWVMVNLNVAEHLSRGGVAASDFFRNGLVVTTSTIHDSLLAKYHPERELDTVLRFGPALHIPSDRPVYVEDSSKGREWFIDSMVEGTLFLMDHLEGSGIGLLPLIKGTVPEEWLRCYRPLSDAGFTHFSFYAGQYFSRKNGRRDAELVNTIRGIVSTCGLDYLAIVGYQSVQRLHDLPTQVKSLAGQRWLRACRVQEVGISKSARLLDLYVSSFRGRRRVRQETIRSPVLRPVGEVA